MTSVFLTVERQSTGDQRSDAELITAVRAGSMEGYGVLYRRHVDAARTMARQMTRSAAELDDLVAEAFARLLDTLRSGGGPDTAFRAYLLTTLRHCMYDKARRDRRVEYSDDLSRFDPGEPFVDTAVAGLEANLVARAFGSLPERWQTVLWHTEVEGETPAQVAPLLGLTPNGVSALAYRAREGLRQAYLQVHLQDTAGEQCRYTVERLGAWARFGLARREKAQVDAHLEGCARCRSLAAELVDVNRGLRSVIAPLVVGAPWLAGYLGAGARTAAVGAAGAATGAAAASGTAESGAVAAGAAGAATASGSAGAATAGATATTGAATAGAAATTGVATAGAAATGAAATAGAAATTGAATVGAATTGAATPGAAAATGAAATTGAATAGAVTAGAAATTGAATAGAVTAGAAATAGVATAGVATAGVATAATGSAGLAAAIGTAAAGGASHVVGVLAKLLHNPVGLATVGAASVAAAIAVGVTVIPGADPGDRGQRPAAPPAAVAESTPGSVTSGPGGPAVRTDPGEPESTAASRGPTPADGTGRGPGGGPTAGGQPAPGHAGPISGGAAQAPAEAGAPPGLATGPAATPDPLRQGHPGVIRIAVRNTGAETVTGLRADVALPPGIVLRGAGGIPGAGNGRPDAPQGVAAVPLLEVVTAPPWICVRTAEGASCTRAALAAGATADLDVRVFVGVAAQPGTLTGTVTADGGWIVAIPASPVDVLPG